MRTRRNDYEEVILFSYPYKNAACKMGQWPEHHFIYHVYHVVKSCFLGVKAIKNPGTVMPRSL